MQTRHVVHTHDARLIHELDLDPVDLVVTSPPYPMIQMWDDVFSQMNPEIIEGLASDDPSVFSLMCDQLDLVWEGVDSVLKPGGIVCINIGDATRKMGGVFQLFPSHARVIQKFQAMGYVCLPEIIWKKPTNSPNKFLGSGMLPPNAYVTLEHEFILIFRKGSPRKFIPQSPERRVSAYFWEERNEWFSDLWVVRGANQMSSESSPRERTAAFPLEIPYRLIHMFSTQGDTVLDPFLGTGTTTLAAIAGGRNSIGLELVPELTEELLNSPEELMEIANSQNLSRIEGHLEFVRRREDADKHIKHQNVNYGFPVITKQEADLKIYRVSSLVREGSTLVAEHEPIAREE